MVHILYLEHGNLYILQGIMYNFTKETTSLMGPLLLSPLGGPFSEVLLYILLMTMGAIKEKMVCSFAIPTWTVMRLRPSVGASRSPHGQSGNSDHS